MGDMRKRMIELILNAPRKGVVYGDIKLDKPVQTAQSIADHLLANGVIVLPCKVGDTVYEIEYDLDSGWWEAYAVDAKVKAICILTENDYYPLDSVGKDVFLTKEKAEQALKERVDDGQAIC